MVSAASRSVTFALGCNHRRVQVLRPKVKVGVVLLFDP